jgi:carbamoyl-phosphate synthase small subunit
MSGYQEILTDPSYRGQMVTMTYPHIGNYGINPEDVESKKPWLAGFIVKEACDLPSNWRSRWSLHDYLQMHGVVGIQGIDTRALTTHLRDHGSQQACISHLDLDPQRVIRKAREAPSILGRDLVREVTCTATYPWRESSGAWKLSANDHAARARPSHFKVVAFDFGIKYNILRRLVDEGCDVTVVPASTTAEAALALSPDGIFLSNGPGDPEGLPYAVQAVRELLGKRPVFGICLGHQIMGLAFGLQTYKLKFGHHGGNHPVMNMETRKVEITAQNHNFAVRAGEASQTSSRDTWRTPYGNVRVSHASLNDEAVEGLRCLDIPAFSVQYHPEASPGPHDASYLFQRFIDLMAKGQL